MIRLDNKDIALALVAIACGGYALLAAAGVIPAQTANATPAWVLGLAGLFCLDCSLDYLSRIF